MMLLCLQVAGDWDAPADRSLWEELLDQLDGVSPLIEDVRPGLAFLDVRGIAGDALSHMTKTRAMLADCGRALRIGAGHSKIAARAALHVGDGVVCERGTEREFLAPLPLELLEIDERTIQRLKLLGVERLGDVALLPHGPFVRRFGSAAAGWHELARGGDRRPFIPRPHAVAIEASIFGEGHAADESAVFFAIRMLLSRICADLERCGKRAGALQLSVELENGEALAFDVPLATPTAEDRTMFALLRAKLEGTTFPAPVIGLRLGALRLEEGGEAQTLMSNVDFDPQRVAVTIARLQAALGKEIVRAAIHPAHRLEERFTYEPFTVPRREPLTAVPAHEESKLVPQLRLLRVREIPVRLRGGEPSVVDRQRVRQCSGPWRITERFGAEKDGGRDEYDVVLEDATCVRIYRQGSHWYLRGVYE
ncbi:MAG: hypothetical protein JO030_05285 [Candidatus Eremiobacteraeota bacterium]|nr:hypothetical protein [Candidatus Eremiobacteraeota bacterium]